MKHALPSRIRRQTDQLQRLILDGRPFQAELAQLYTELRLQARYADMIQVYRLLLLCVPPGQQAALYHPALLQAFLALGRLEEAQRAARELAQRPDPETRKLTAGLAARLQGTLPAYTPLAALSRYAAPAANTRPVRRTLPAAWTDTWQQLTPQKLHQLGYYAKRARLARLPQPERQQLVELFDEFFLNYLFGSSRAVAVLAGALLESLLARYLRRHKHMTHVKTRSQNKKNVSDATLYELLSVYAQHQWLPEGVLRLCRAARVQRNYIHPGKENTEHTRLAPAGTQICYLAVMETMDMLL